MGTQIDAEPGRAGNIADLLRATAQRDPDHPALILIDPPAGTTDAGDPAEDRRVTWADLDADVDAVCRGLLAEGLAPGDRIAIRMANVLEFPVTYFAAARAGLVVVPVNPAYTARELAHILTDAGAERLFSTADLPDPAGLADDPLPVPTTTTLPRADGPAPAPGAGGDDLAVLLYTSGTTGLPKGAMLPHRALLANLDQCAQLSPAPMTPADIVLLALPLFHVYGLNAAMGMLARTGATAVLLRRFDVAASLAAMARYRVTNVPGAPPIYRAWLEHGEPAALRAALASVRMATSGAAPLPAALLNRMREEFAVTIFEGYGLTETAPVLASTLATGRIKPGCIGQPIPGVALRLWDGPTVVDPAVVLTDDPVADADPYGDPYGEPDEDDDTGEIQVRGANVFLGYWPDGRDGPDSHGWFATGDVGYRDTDGDLYLVDRRRDLILVNGFNVYPREVETVLGSHPGIAEAAVLGVSDQRTGESVRAVVVLGADQQLTEAEVIDWAGQRLARFKCPASVQFVEELPHSVTGKISKARLRELGFADVAPGDPDVAQGDAEVAPGED